MKPCYFQWKHFHSLQPMLNCISTVSQSFKCAIFVIHWSAQNVEKGIKHKKDGGWGKGKNTRSYWPGLTHPLCHPYLMTLAIVLCLTSRTPMLASISLNYTWKWSNNSQREDYSENSTLMTQVSQFSSVLLSYRLKAYDDEVGIISIHMQSTL